MELVKQETYGRFKEICSNIKRFSGLCGEAGLSEEAQDISAWCDGLEKEGISLIAVLGKFNCGKSTLINAMVEKNMMTAKATVNTAVIATVGYGDDCDKVKVIYTDKAPREMTLHDFWDKFQITEENIEKMYFFEDVSHVEMHSKDDFFKTGVRLIDTPGLEDRVSATKTTIEYVPKANAIIFVLNAVALFSSMERDYINENFAGKHLRNIFFVVNRIDQLDPGQLEELLIPHVRAGLEEVFIDENGNFDENLYKRRVFFTNVYGAFCARINEPCKVFAGRKAITVPIEIGDTGIEAFESALAEFLDSGERIAAAFAWILRRMCFAYKSSMEHKAFLETRKDYTSDSEIERFRDINEQMRTLILKVYEPLHGYAPAEKVILEFAGFMDKGSSRRFARRGSDF